MTERARDRLIRELKLRLGGGMVEIDLDQDHFDHAVDSALDRYRQRSSNAVEESFLFIDLQPDVSVYTLPNEVQEVRAVLRRTASGTPGSGASFDPFAQAFTNQLYMLQNTGGMGVGGVGYLATYDLAYQFQNVVGRLFGRDLMYTWDAATRRLTLHRKITATESVCLHIYNTRPEEILLADPYARPWLRDYSAAMCKMMLAEAYQRFGQLAGPQGGVSLNGDALKADASAEFERLENELKDFIDSADGAWAFTFG